MVLSRQAVMDIIPHKEPFVFIDAVTDVEYGQRAVGYTDGLAAYKFFRDIGAGTDRPFSFMAEKPVAVENRMTAVTRVADFTHLFEGHFPQQSVFPGALSLAACVELAAVMAGGRLEGRTPFLRYINTCRFRRVILPGDELQLEAAAEADDEETPIQTTAVVDGETATVAKLTFAGQDWRTPLLDPNANFYGCILIEAAAEAAAVAALGLAENRGKLAFLVGVQNWRFHAPVPLRERITMEARMKAGKGGFAKGMFSTSTADGILAEGEMLFFLNTP